MVIKWQEPLPHHKAPLLNDEATILINYNHHHRAYIPYIIKDIHCNIFIIKYKQLIVINDFV